MFHILYTQSGRISGQNCTWRRAFLDDRRYRALVNCGLETRYLFSIVGKFGRSYFGTMVPPQRRKRKIPKNVERFVDSTFSQPDYYWNCAFFLGEIRLFRLWNKNLLVFNSSFLCWTYRLVVVSRDLLWIQRLYQQPAITIDRQGNYDSRRNSCLRSFRH